MTAEPFNDRPFTLQPVIGLRSFDIDTDDRTLLGIIHRRPWGPGENIAECIRPPGFTAASEKYLPEGEHRVGSFGCKCGFYAYFGRTNHYRSRGRWGVTVTGIVEGYGIVTVGPYGFRAEKARLLALARSAYLDPCDDPGCPCVTEIPAMLDRFYGVAEERYGVPLYSSVDDALAAHPTTRPSDVGYEDQPDEDEDYLSGLGVTVKQYLSALNIPAQGRVFYLSTGAAVLGGAVRTRDSGGGITFATSSNLPFLQPVAKPERPERPETVVQRLQRTRRERAERRNAAGLSNLGGINRRKRGPK